MIILLQTTYCSSSGLMRRGTAAESESIVEQIKGRVMISEVITDSIADTAGLCVGDIILTVSVLAYQTKTGS